MVRAVGYKILLHYFLGLHDLVLPNHSVSSIGFHLQYFFFFFFQVALVSRKKIKSGMLVFMNFHNICSFS